MTLAGSQAGVLSAHQLADSGLSKDHVRRLLTTGQLRRVRRGVYAVASAGSDPNFALWIAIVSSGPAAFACRRSAAELWGFDGVESGALDVAVPPGRHPRGAGVVRLIGITSQDVTTVAGAPATSATRTLVDLGAVADVDVVERAVECALRRGIVSLGELRAAADLTQSAGRHRLRSVLARRPPGAAATESDAETIFQQICRRAGLPDPDRQVRVRIRGRTYRLDYAWWPVLLAIEIDGAATHGPGQLTADLRRQNAIVLEGWLVLRFSWAMLVYEPERVIAEIRAAWRIRSVAISY